MRIARAAATVGFAAIVIALFPAAAQASAATITGAQSARITPQDTPWGPPQNTPPSTAMAPLDTPWG